MHSFDKYNGANNRIVFPCRRLVMKLDLRANSSKCLEHAGEIKQAKSFSENSSSAITRCASVQSAPRELVRNPESGSLAKWSIKLTGAKDDAKSLVSRGDSLWRNLRLN